MLNLILPGGPRVGSSFLAMKVAEAGLPMMEDPMVVGLPEGGQPRTGGRYYELDPSRICRLTAGVVKLWPKAAHLLETVPSAIVYLTRRNEQAQLVSCQLQLSRELEFFTGNPAMLEALHEVDCRGLIEESKDLAEKFISEHDTVPLIRADTEDLGRDHAGLVDFLRQPR
mgnify:CR=1 FL=1